jgi:ankyrin repeat protein
MGNQSQDRPDPPKDQAAVNSEPPESTDSGVTPLDRLEPTIHRHDENFDSRRTIITLNAEDISKFSESLRKAARNGNLQDVKMLLDEGADVAAADNDGGTALHWAAAYGRLDVVTWLVEHGEADVHAKDDTGRTVLHRAALNGELYVAKWLVEHGKADINAKDKIGWTALHYGASNGNLDMVTWLVEHGKADVHVTNKYGATALDLAREGDWSGKVNKHVVKLLESAHSKMSMRNEDHQL